MIGLTILEALALRMVDVVVLALTPRSLTTLILMQRLQLLMVILRSSFLSQASAQLRRTDVAERPTLTRRSHKLFCTRWLDILLPPFSYSVLDNFHTAWREAQLD